MTKVKKQLRKSLAKDIKMAVTQLFTKFQVKGKSA